MMILYYNDGNSSAMSGIAVISSLLPTWARRWRNYAKQELRIPCVELLVDLLVKGNIFSDRRKWEQVVRSAKVLSEYSGTKTSTAEIRGLYTVYLLQYIALHSNLVLKTQYL